MSTSQARRLERSKTQPVPPAATEGPAESRPDHKVYVVAPKRTLMHAGKLLNAGDVVEGAHLWLRVETWVATGRIVEKTWP